MPSMIFYNPEHCPPEMVKYVGQEINLATGRPIGMDKETEDSKQSEHNSNNKRRLK